LGKPRSQKGKESKTVGKPLQEAPRSRSSGLPGEEVGEDFTSNLVKEGEHSTSHLDEKGKGKSKRKSHARCCGSRQNRFLLGKKIEKNGESL